MDRTLLFILVGVGALAFATWAGVAAEMWKPRSKRHVRALVVAEFLLAPIAVTCLFLPMLRTDLPFGFLGLTFVLLVNNLRSQRFCSICGHRVPAMIGLPGRPAVHCRLCAQPLVRLRDLRVSAS